MIIKLQNAVTRLYNGTRSARWAMCSQVITSGSNFLTALIIVRSLGLEEFGRFSICFLLLMIVRNFLIGTILTPMSSIGSKLTRVSRPAYRGFLVVNGLVFALGSSLVLYIGATVFGTAFNLSWLPEFAIPLVVANFLSLAADFFRRYHFVNESPPLAFGVDLIRYCVQMVILLGFISILEAHFSAQIGLWAIAIGSGGGAVFGYGHYGWLRWSQRLSDTVWPRHWNFIKWMTPSYILDAIQHNAPLFIAGAFLGEVGLGTIRAMQQLANVLNLPLNALQQVAPSLAATAYKKSGNVGMNKFLVWATILSTVFLGLMATFTFTFSNLIVEKLFHVSVDTGVPVLIFYFAVNQLILLRLPLMIRMQSIETPAKITLSSLFGALTAVLFGYLLVDTLGLISAPVAAIIGLVCNICVYATLYFHEHKKL
ncbi:MAG: hypothetical protein GY761_12200 [Hyphomicrobiales bacterium]|nr:hypothetical protein [Hyphomicrobiales bacterium]